MGRARGALGGGRARRSRRLKPIARRTPWCRATPPSSPRSPGWRAESRRFDRPHRCCHERVSPFSVCSVEVGPSWRAAPAEVELARQAALSSGAQWFRSVWLTVLLVSICFEGLGRRLVPAIPSMVFYFMKDVVLLVGFVRFRVSREVMATFKFLYRGYAPFLKLAILWTFAELINPSQLSHSAGLAGRSRLLVLVGSTAGGGKRPVRPRGETKGGLSAGVVATVVVSLRHLAVWCSGRGHGEYLCDRRRRRGATRRSWNHGTRPRRLDLLVYNWIHGFLRAGAGASPLYRAR